MSYLNLFEEHSLFFMFLAALAEEISLASYAREEEGIHRGRFCSPRPVELYIPSGKVQGDNEKSNGGNEIGLHVPVSFKFVAACIIALHGFCLLRAIRIHTYTYNETP